MALPRLAATIRASVAALAADYGPHVEKYAIPLDVPKLFKWVIGSALTADNLTVLGHTGGTPGRWILQRLKIKGADLGDADVTIHVTGNFWRRIPAGTLTAPRTITLGTTNAAEGDMHLLTRFDVSANAVTVANGGAGAGTITTMPVSARSLLLSYYDGTNWLHCASCLLL